MCLLDTLDGALMLTLYTSPSLSKDPIAILYYSIVLTAITVVVALVIGAIQLLTLIVNVAEPEGAFWEGVRVAGDNYDKIGKLVCFSHGEGMGQEVRVRDEREGGWKWSEGRGGRREKGEARGERGEGEMEEGRSEKREARGERREGRGERGEGEEGGGRRGSGGNGACG